MALDLLSYVVRGNQIDRHFLRTVQSGAAGLGISSETWLGLLLVFFLIVIMIIFCYLLNKFYFKSARIGPSSLDQVTSREEILSILGKARDQSRILDITFTRPPCPVPSKGRKKLNHGEGEENIRGRILELRSSGEILLEADLPGNLNRTPGEIDVEIDFKIDCEKKVDSYSFYSTLRRFHPLSAGSEDGKTMCIRPPDRLIRIQKRMHLRVSPSDDYAVWVEILAERPDGTVPIEKVDSLPPLRVKDISISGMKMIYRRTHPVSGCRENETLYLRFHLPAADLDPADSKSPQYLYMESRVLQNDTIGFGKKILRLEFTKRGFMDEDGHSVRFRELNDLMNEDISRWIHRYDRQMIIQEEVSLP